MNEKTWKKIISLVKKGYTQSEVAAAMKIERSDLSHEVKHAYGSWGDFRIKVIFKSHKNYQKICGPFRISTHKKVPKNSKIILT